MKKILSIILGAFICAQSFAQISVNAGYLNSSRNYNGKNSSTAIVGNGAYAGFETDFNVLPLTNSCISVGAYFDFVNYILTDHTNATSFGFRVPAHFKYSVGFGKDGVLFVSAGPSVSVGAFGNYITRLGNVTYTEDFYNDENARFDLSLGAKVGFDLMRKIRVSLGYDFGLLDQNQRDPVVKRNFLQVGIGYLF